MKNLIIAITFIIFMLAFTGCAHEHTFSNADCLIPKTCTECGETEGIALGHKWTAATCTTAKKCANCGQTEGSALGHTWTAATCTTAKKCSNCGQTEGSAIGHKWTAATCTTAKKCSSCGQTEGVALGHTWKDATCTKPKTCTKCNATSGDALGHTTGGLNCSRCGVSTVVYYKEHPSVPDLGAILGVSLIPGWDTKYGYAYYSKDIYHAAGPNAIDQYINILKATGFSLVAASNGSNIYQNKTSGLRVSMMAVTVSTDQVITISVY